MFHRSVERAGPASSAVSGTTSQPGLLPLIGALAYNLMVALKLLDLKDDCQGWQFEDA